MTTAPWLVWALTAVVVTGNPAGVLTSNTLGTPYYSRTIQSTTMVNPQFAIGKKCARCSVIAWGGNGGTAPAEVINPTDGKEIVNVAGSRDAFAAIRKDGSVIAWGIGPGTTMPEQLLEAPPHSSGAVVEIASTVNSFVALRANGSVSAWGASTIETLPSALVNGDVGVRSLATTYFAVAATLSDNSVIAWGNTGSGGSTPNNVETVQPIASTGVAFAAIQTDGSIAAWGSNTGGGTTPVGNEDVVRIASTPSAFAAVKTDGSVIAWGVSVTGLVPAPTEAGPATDIASSDGAFASIRTDGSVVAWGPSGSGGEAPSDLTGTPATNKRVIGIASTFYAFVALKEDGSVLAWGDAANGGDAGDFADTGTGPPAQGKEVRAIASTIGAFAALTVDGSVVAWGNIALPPSELTNPAVDKRATSIISSTNTFVVLRADGSVFSWGGSSGQGSPPLEVTAPAPGASVVAIVSAEYAFAAIRMIPCPAGKYSTGPETALCEPCPAGKYSNELGATSSDTCIPLRDPRMHVVQLSDDKLAMRIDDEADDQTYSFVDQLGRLRVNSNVYDSAEETLVVSGSTRLRGDVFLNDDMGSELSLQQQLATKLSCTAASPNGILMQSGTVEVRQDAPGSCSSPIFCVTVALPTPLVDGTEIILLSLRTLVADLDAPASCWLKDVSVTPGEGVDGFVAAAMVDTSSADVVIAEVTWLAFGTPA